MYATIASAHKAHACGHVSARRKSGIVSYSAVVCGTHARASSSRASARFHFASASRRSGPPHRVIGATMCGTVTKPARHSLTHPGEIRKLAASSSAQPSAVRQRGNAAKSARPIVGFATSRNPAAGRRAAPVRSSDHCAVCSAISAGSDTSATSAGDRRSPRVIAQANNPKPIATKKMSAQCIDAIASGVIVNTAVIGYMSGNVVSNARPGPTDAYGS